MSPFKWVYTDDGYTDYEFLIPDNRNGIGGRVRITLNHADGTAYALLSFDNKYGDELLISDAIPLTMQTAKDIVADEEVLRAQTS